MAEHPKAIQIGVAPADNEGPAGVVVLDDHGRILYRSLSDRDPFRWMELPALPPIDGETVGQERIAQAVQSLHRMRGVIDQTVSEIGVTTDTAELRALIREALVVLGAEPENDEETIINGNPDAPAPQGVMTEERT